MTDGARPDGEIASETRTVTIEDAELTITTWGSEPAEIVILHDGLGSIEQFKSFPVALHLATDKSVMAYDRPGHGASRPNPAGPWPQNWLQIEAERFHKLLKALAIDEPVVVGHSDGGSIALLHAAAEPAAVSGVVAIACHSYVEDVCFEKIFGMRKDSRLWTGALKNFHSNPSALFDAWSGRWTSSEFRSWDIRTQIGSIVAPTLIVQGERDEYATDAMATGTAAAIGGNAECVLVAGGKHLLPQQDEQTTVELIASFAKRT